LLLGQANVLVLDEPGNHLDVDTVDALANALVEYRGTVVFTSHDRYFLARVATCIIEVRDGRVVNYPGQYDAYLYAVNKEIEEGERELSGRMSKPPTSAMAAPKPNATAPAKNAKPRNDRERRKEIVVLERTVSRLEDQKRQLNAQFLAATDPAESLRLHDELIAIATQLTTAESRWCQLQEELPEGE
jgi:ATP-binding cassette, subfamily F, member 3